MNPTVYPEFSLQDGVMFTALDLLSVNVEPTVMLVGSFGLLSFIAAAYSLDLPLILLIKSFITLIDDNLFANFTPLHGSLYLLSTTFCFLGIGPGAGPEVPPPPPSKPSGS